MSLYSSAPGVAAVRIAGYPKRYRQKPSPVATATLETRAIPAHAVREVCYADFFRADTALAEAS